MTTMLFHIRAELPDGTCRDFKQAGEEHKVENEATLTSAASNARTRVDTSLRAEFGADTTTQWRGMVVFVNRAVPLAAPLAAAHTH